MKIKHILLSIIHEDPLSIKVIFNTKNRSKYLFLKSGAKLHYIRETKKNKPLF